MVCDKSPKWLLYAIYHQLHNDPKTEVPLGKKVRKETEIFIRDWNLDTDFPKFS